MAERPAPIGWAFFFSSAPCFFRNKAYATGFAVETFFAMSLLAILCLACLGTSIILRITDPLVPQIADDFSVSAHSIALLASAFTFPYALGQPFLGPLGDSIGKTVVIKFCLGLVALSLATCMLAPNVETLFIARMISGVAGGGVIPLSLALVGDRFDFSKRQSALAKILAATLGGQIIGGILAGTLGTAFGWRAVMGFTTAAPVACFFMTQRHLDPGAKPNRAPLHLETIRANYLGALKNPRAKFCYTAVFVEGILVLGIVPYLAILLEEYKTGSVREAGLVLAGLGTGGIVFSLSVKHLLRILGGQMNLFRTGGVIAAAGFAAYAFTHNPVYEAFSFIVLGVGFYMMHNSLQTQATELAPDARGAAVALHAFSFFLGQAVGPILYGLGFKSLGTLPTLLISVAALAGLGFWVAHHITRIDRKDTA